MNKLRKALVLVVASLSIGGLAGCDIIDKLTPGQHETEKKNFEGLTLENATVTYDGQAHSISVTGNLPEGAQVSYGQAGNSFTEVGQHSIQAVISAEGYNDLSLSAVLTIVNADFAGLSLTDLTVTYDGQPHSIEVAGEVPQGAQVSYGDGGNTFTAPGVYNISASVTATGYTTLNLEAVLTINKAQFEGIVFDNATVAYDGQPHSIAPVVPAEYAGAQVTYGDAGNTFTGSGLHVVEATVSLENYEDWTGTAKLNIGPGPDAVAPLEVNDFEDMTENDLQDEFELLFYGNSGWVEPQSAKLSLEDNQIIGSGKTAMKMSLTHQGSAFKATTEIGANDKTYNKYSGFSIDAKMNPVAEGTAKLQVQFWYKDLPLPDQYAAYRSTYATYTLAEDAPRVWTHYEIPFTDESLSIASGQIPTSALDLLGVTMKDLSAYIDKVAIIVTPNYVSGYNCFAYIDNIELNNTTTKVVEKHIVSGTYGFEIEGNLVTLDIADTFDSGVIKVNGSSANAVIIEQNGNNVVIKDGGDPAGEKLTINAAIADEGGLKVESISGSQATAYSMLENQRFVKLGNLNYDLQNEEKTNHALADTNWVQRKWDGDWIKIQNQMNVRFSGDNVFANMTTGYYMDYDYTYTNASKLGLINKLSIDLANDFINGGKNPGNIKVKVKLITDREQEVYAVGSASNYVEIPSLTGDRNNNVWYRITASDFGNVNVKSIRVTVKSTRDGSDYLYFDNLKASFETENSKFNKTVSAGSYYIWNSASNAFILDLDEGLTSGTFHACGSDPIAVDVKADEERLYVSDHDSSGKLFTLVGVISDDNAFTFKYMSGSARESFASSLLNKTIRRCKSVELDFSDGTKDSVYTESHWKEQHYGSSSWTEYATPTQMRSKVDKNNNKVVNFAASTTAYNFLYTPDLSMGPVNHLDIDLGNYFSSSPDTIRYKIALLGSDGNVSRYVAGDASTWATIAKDTSQGNLCKPFSFDFDLAVAYKVRITVSTQSGSGYLYMDNLKVSYKAPTPVVPTKTIEDGKYYIWNGNTDAFRLEISNSLTEATVAKCGGDSYAMTVEVNDETVTFKDAANSGAGLTIKATITAQNAMTVTEVTGAAASLVSGSLLDKNIKHCADVSVDFSDGTVGSPYSNSHWTCQQYTTKWEDITPDMNCRNDASSNKVVNLVSGGYTRNFIYTPDLPMGPVNHISFDMANYYNGSAGDIQVKVCVIDGGGTKYYALGSTDEFVTITKDTSAGSVLVHYDKSINLCAGAKIQITTKASAGTSYLYVDNFQVNYAA